MASLTERMLKLGAKGASELSDTLDKTKFLNGVAEYPTPVRAINIALSGRIDGGLTSGLLIIAGKSRHFKTTYGLICVKTFLDANPDGICLFYDNEFGAALKYFQSVGIDPSRVVHIPISNIEELKRDISIKTSATEDGAIKRGEKVIIFVDSIGNLASIKEVRDAENENDAADMTRAKALKSMFRIITPRARILDIPMIMINHVYDGQGMYATTTMSGGQGPMLSANEVWFIGKAQEREGNEVVGFTFTINIEKGRRVKEKSKIPIKVRFDGGISPWSGMYEIAMAMGYITIPSRGWRTRPHIPGDKKWQESEIFQNEDAFFSELIAKTDFAEAIAKKYQLSTGKLINTYEDDEPTPEDFEDIEDVAT